ncbi:unnamed protein product [Rhodiola kirilowii]
MLLLALRPNLRRLHRSYRNNFFIRSGGWALDLVSSALLPRKTSSSSSSLETSSSSSEDESARGYCSKGVGFFGAVRIVDLGFGCGLGFETQSRERERLM